MTVHSTQAARPGLRHETVLANGLRQHVVLAGEGEPILLLHGFLGTWRVWRDVIPLLSARFTVVAPDLRGFGDTEKPASGYDGLSMVEDLRALVASLGLGRPRLVAAHDMGALAYLDEPVLLPESLRELLAFRRESFAPQGGLWWWAFAQAPGAPEMLIGGREAEFLRWFYDRYAVHRESFTTETVEETARTMRLPGGVAGALGVYRAVFDTADQTAALTGGKVSIPVLGLGGEASQGEGVAASLRGGGERVRRSRARLRPLHPRGAARRTGPPSDRVRRVGAVSGRSRRPSWTGSGGSSAQFRPGPPLDRTRRQDG